MSSDRNLNYKLPKIEKNIGKLHPINQIKNSIINFLESEGFMTLNGPEIESEL